MSEIHCSFIKKCKNYNKHCELCKWNASTEIKDYLEIVSDGKSVKFLYG